MNPLLSLLCVLLEKVVFPALARSRDEEPVVVESDLIAAHLVVTVTFFRRGCRTFAVATLKKLVQVLQR